MSSLINHLMTVAEYWRNPSYPLRCQAIAQAKSEFYLSVANFELGLDWIFSQWDLHNITQLIATNPFRNIQNAVQILAGNTPAVIAQAFLQGAILQVPQWLKLPRNCTQFARLLLQSLQQVDASLAALFYCDTWEHNLAEFYAQLNHTDLVIAYGSDVTIDTLMPYLGQNTRFVPHGHLQSAAIIFKEAAQPDALLPLAWDMLSYDQRGCLSPQVVFVEQGGALTPAACAKLFAREILPNISKQLPSGGLTTGEAVAVLQQRSLYGFRGAVYGGDDWTVCYDETLTWPQPALPRFMPFKPFTDSATLRTALAPVTDKLICIGVAGDLQKIPALNLQPCCLICPLGTMQQQLLGW